MRKTICTLALTSILAVAGIAGAGTSDEDYGTTRTDTMAATDPSAWTFDMFDQRWCIGEVALSLSCDVHAIASPPALPSDQQDALLMVPEPFGSWLSENVDETSG